MCQKIRTFQEDELFQHVIQKLNSKPFAKNNDIEAFKGYRGTVIYPAKNKEIEM